MSSQVQIVNRAMTLLGESRIASIDDDLKQARSAKAMWDISRDALLAAHNWTFAMHRRTVEALSDEPEWGFDRQFQVPTDCLRLVQIGELYVGLDLTDYRSGSSEEYMLEGDRILTSMSAPLKVRYVRRITDTTKFSQPFAASLAAKLALDMCEDLTQSPSKKEAAKAELGNELRNAVRANAIQVAPQHMPDDEWLMARR